jgi:hypothetical protein
LNVAADAVINTSLENLTALKTPSDAWTLSRIWQCLEKSEDAPDNPQAAAANKSSAHYSSNTRARAKRKIANLTRNEFCSVNRWSCEELYYFLKSRCRSESFFEAILTEFDERDALSGDDGASGIVMRVNGAKRANRVSRKETRACARKNETGSNG